MSNYRAIIKYQ